jgi:hypothetical protein
MSAHNHAIPRVGVMFDLMLNAMATLSSSEIESHGADIANARRNDSPKEGGRPTAFTIEIFLRYFPIEQPPLNFKKKKW